MRISRPARLGPGPPARRILGSRADAKGGFAIWSGTSFAAPYLAGKLATWLVGLLPTEEEDRENPDRKRDAVRRGWDAVAEVTGIKPS